MFCSKFLLVVLVCFILSSYWLLVIVSLVVIGHCDFLGSGFYGLDQKALTVLVLCSLISLGKAEHIYDVVAHHSLTDDKTH